MRKAYPSDIAREAYAKIEAQLLAVTKGTQPRHYDLYDVFCAVLYVLKEGCTWRALPHDSPKWQNCYYHFRRWKKPDDKGETVLDRLLNDLVEAAREEDGRAQKTPMIIVDSKSIKNVNSAEEKGYDAGKKLPESSSTSESIPTAGRTRCLSAPRI
jgi:transposase